MISFEISPYQERFLKPLLIKAKEHSRANKPGIIIAQMDYIDSDTVYCVADFVGNEKAKRIIRTLEEDESCATVSKK